MSFQLKDIMCSKSFFEHVVELEPRFFTYIGLLLGFLGAQVYEGLSKALLSISFSIIPY
jgi:hypothetical protein